MNIKNFIMPIIMLIIAILGGIIYMAVSNKNKKEIKSNDNGGGEISQLFINIQDIEDNILYGLDGIKRMIISLDGINIELLNKNDINKLIKNLSSEISKLSIEFDICGISKPFDVESLKEEYEEEIENAETDIQRTLLRNSLKQINNLGESGEVTERKFYIILQSLDNENEIKKQAELIIECFKNSGLNCEILSNAGIKRFINLFNNMSTYNYDIEVEDDYNNATIPMIKEGLQKKKTIEEKLKEQEIEKENNEEIKNMEENENGEKEKN